jgi:hypothetical protein
MPARPVKHLHALKPKSLAGFTRSARGATFQQLTRNLGTGIRAQSGASYDPFSGADAAKWFGRTRNLDAQARAWVARAVREPGVRAKISGNTGTVPELVVVGRFLSKGYRLGVNLYFQDKALALKGFRLTKPFIPDVAILAPGGTLILLPIDGRYVHARTLKEQIDAQARNRALSFLGTVVVIQDTECTSGARLNGYLSRKQVP